MISAAAPISFQLGVLSIIVTAIIAIPLGMIANPDLIRLKADPAGATLSFVQMAIGLSSVSFGIISNFNKALRVAFVSLGLALIFLRVLM